MGLGRFSIVDVVEFQVLGPLRVEDGGREFALGGPKQRTLLALLVAAAGSPLSMDALLMGVYGPDADPKSRRTLHTYISRYRSSLGHVIERSGDGYALTADPSSIDAVRFEDSIRHAKSMTDESQSAEVLRGALSLWRGRPYADVDTAELASEAQRLEELKAEAIEARIAYELALGRHRELVSELESLVAQHPEREQFRALQMLALYRSGRQTEALEAYRAAAEYLREESGLDPSPNLRTLEHQILTQDRSIDYRPRARHRPIPARYTSFVGRSGELARVLELIDTRRLVTITGPGGVGKSSLAAEVARASADRMQAVFVPVEAERHHPIAVLVARSLGLEPTDGADVLDMIARTLDDAPTLLLLDGCEHVLDELPAVVAELLRRSPNARILVTSREPLFMTGEHRFALEPLSTGTDSPGARLFLDRASIRRDQLDELMEDQVVAIVTAVAGLPLGIELAAARSRTMPLAHMASQLDDQANLLAIERGPDPRHLSMTTALDWSYRLLDERKRRAFRQLSVFSTGMIPLDGAAVVLDDAEPAALLTELVDVSMLSPPDDQGRFRILEPIRQYAASKLDEAGERLDTDRRHAEWLMTLAGEMRHLAWMGHAEQALPRLRAQAPAIAAAASWAIEHGEPNIVLELVAKIGRIWPHVADPRLLRESATHVLQTMETPLSDVAVAALAHTAVLYRLDEPDTARELGARAEALAREVDDPATLQIVYSSLAVVPYGADRHLEPAQAAECLGWWEKSSVLLHELGYPVEAHYRNRVNLLYMLGRHSEADEGIESMLAFADDTRPGVRGHALELLASSLMRRGDLVAGLRASREASRLLIDGGDLDYAAEAERRSANARELLEQYDESQQAITRHDELHALIGLPPMAEEEPLLVAATAAGLEQWDDFVAVMRDARASAPSATDESAYSRFLLGDPDRYEHFVHMIAPLARWLMRGGRSAKAAAVVAAAPMAFELSAFTLWEEIGDVARVERLAEELADVEPLRTLESLDALWRFMAECLDSE